MGNQYSRLLASLMYKDRCTISRQMATTDDIGATVYDLVDVYTDVPCKLGQSGQGSMSGTQTDSVFTVNNRLRLSLPPELDVMVNDIITIQHQGQTFIMRADTPFKYMSHQEIGLIYDGEA